MLFTTLHCKVVADAFDGDESIEVRLSVAAAGDVNFQFRALKTNRHPQLQKNVFL